jgi:hypothetical protein
MVVKRITKTRKWTWELWAGNRDRHIVVDPAMLYSNVKNNKIETFKTYPVFLNKQL